MKNTSNKKGSLLMAWLKASRVTAQVFIFPSILLGQILAMMQTGEFSMLMFTLVSVYGIFMHLFIVYANDYADVDTDRLNKTYTIFSGGSRVLLEGILSKKNLFYGAIIMSFFCILLGVILWILTSSPLVFILIVSGLFLLYAYSFKPFNISYRGFGEILQMLGVGVVLPLIGFVSQNGNLKFFPWIFVIMILPSQLAMAISTSLPDHPSDLLSLKRTSVVLLGLKNAQIVIILMHILSLSIFILTQSELYFNFWGIVIICLFILSICFQLLMFLFKSLKPGTKSLTFFVLLSILTNTAFILGMIFLLKI